MGLAKKLIFSGLLIFALWKSFDYGRDQAKIEKQDVLDYIDTHEGERKDIFLHARNYFLENDPSYLNSLIPKERREKITLDYLSDPKNYIEVNSKLFAKDVKKFSKEAKDFYESLKEQNQ